MAVTIGSVLGTYEITALLGKGGMREVYRARDSRLSRDVALKVLPAEFALDASRRSRFEREARSDVVTFVQSLGSSKGIGQSRISADGRRIAYYDASGIYIVSTSGGNPIQALAASHVYSVCWSPDGEWIWFSQGPFVLAKVSSQGGEPQPVKVPAGVLADCSPHGNWLLRFGETGILLTSTDGTQNRLLTNNSDYAATSAQFGAAGKVVYLLARNQRSIDVLDSATGKKLRTIAFDLKPEDVISRFSINATGDRVLLSTGGDRNDVWIAEGFAQPTTSVLRWFQHWDISRP